MSFVRKTFKGAAVGVAVADDPAGLRAFFAAGMRCGYLAAKHAERCAVLA
jgi:beta-phosphoglucomutase-like phosphatase (HAD superfamily)